ncbi:zinc finger CCCH domain-containing protein 23 [Selaginella moellendorffii]|uniref:zinc finger CCCH domain-containing protein 23 n=1 Tax=Selaginella moellendorffii TaxID=88036 RepID=UPI000D1CB7CF|nr:zinc finger CCCH domain-containing protein 23 [Selaginella moellendorffii]|eukprot:XP_024528121.1 zinc finger CCCH domain-containing protein 23 [Selaginella moellendorffii]
MDPYELTRMLYARVQALDPRHVSKIIGYLLLQDEAEQDMLRMALGSDALLFSVVDKAKQELGLSPSPNAHFDHPAPFSRPEHPPFHFGTAFDHQLQSTYHLRDVYHPPLVNSHVPFQKQLQQQAELMNRPSIQDTYQHQPLFGAGVFPNDHFYPETFAFLNRNRLKQQKQQQQKSDEHDLMLSLSEHGSPNSSSSSSNNSSHAWKPCVYYSRGHCKHGSGCRFLHTPNSLGIEEHGTESALERLELEIQELLRARKSPVPISLLPQMYFEEFGSALHVDGFLATPEAVQGSGLTSLLCHMKNTLVIDQPNGQQAVVLVEESSRLAVAAHRGDNYDHNGIVSPSSRQIYLTFPAESAFTEEDVNAHFSAYGPVQDVRIPYQQKRMFGFVTFIHAETVKTILAEGNPHYVCGARVLVKPYRDKVKYTDKKNADQQSRNVRNNTDLASKLLEESMQQQQQRENYLQQRLVEFRLQAVDKPQDGATDVLLKETNINLGYILEDDDTHRKTSHSNRNTYSRAASFPENPFAVTYEQETTKLVS